MIVELLIIGLGYVGLPLAYETARAGANVTGYDTNPGRVSMLNAGMSPVDDLSDNDIARMQADGFSAVSELPDIKPDVIVICVPTPLSEDDGPDLTAVRKAAGAAALMLRPGTLVSLESTTYPGTTEEVVRPILELASGLTAGEDFHLVFSPERIDPGNPEFGLANTPKVVGGVTRACAEAGADFYGKICRQVVIAKSTREAEMAKLLENTYRHVNIALVNEMAVFCHEMDIDLWDAIECASTKPFGFQAFRPGPGVGGHCIPIDPNYLSYKVRQLGYPFRFVELAQEINRRMPAYVVTRAAEMLNDAGMPLKGSLVALMGVTYKPDIADQRESPAPQVARKLMARGAALRYHDPYVQGWTVDGERIGFWNPAEDHADLVILLQAHSSYDLQTLTDSAPMLLDTTGRVPRERPHVETFLVPGAVALTRRPRCGGPRQAAGARGTRQACARLAAGQGKEPRTR